MQCNIYGYLDPQSFVFSGSKYISFIFLWVDFPKMITKETYYLIYTINSLTCM